MTRATLRNLRDLSAGTAGTLYDTEQAQIHAISLRPIDPCLALIAAALKNVQLYVVSSMRDGHVRMVLYETL